MAETQETHAAVIAEMRERCIDEQHSPTLWPYFDRLEAAHKRELAERGNAAAMREALKRCEAISHFPEIREQQCVKDMRNIIAHALAAPPRNCEVGTAEERRERFDAFCDKYDNDCTGCPCDDAGCASHTDCFEKWSQMPYEAEEGGAE